MATPSRSFDGSVAVISVVVEKLWTSGVVDNWAMAKKRIPDDLGLSALSDIENQEPMAVRYLLQLLETNHPGGTIELRVPPHGAVQLVGGLNHRRGTPPNVVELDPKSFFELAMGTASFETLQTAGRVLVSGARANELRELFPLGGLKVS